MKTNTKLVWFGLLLTVPLNFAILSIIEAAKRETRQVPGKTETVLLETCGADLKSQREIYDKLSERQEWENKELKDRLQKALDDLETADNRAMKQAKEINCGESLVAAEYTLWVCRKHLHRADGCLPVE